MGRPGLAAVLGSGELTGVTPTPPPLPPAGRSACLLSCHRCNNICATAQRICWKRLPVVFR
eukprot:7492820-Alexandrium_andersonii.AAC.1